MTTRATTAVILARGLGSRMQQTDAHATMTAVQAAMADTGVKALIPDARNRPLLDHILTALADGGVTDVCLVVAPDHRAIDAHYQGHPTRRIALATVVQAEARGTANALLAAEAWLAGRSALVLNADNLYPVAAIRALVDLGAPGLIAFEPQALVADGNIAPERLAAFAILDIRADGTLARIVEKPDTATLPAGGPTPWISMNIWRFDHGIFAACRAVPRSVRGEYELPMAVQFALDGGAIFQAIRLRAGVLDLSYRADIAAVAVRLGALAVNT
ncbi:MAG TPA: sugar phosphate nucleotidyltransferase [Gemmatimonadales bacterium]|jgi:glucose-1-phosphate thymidylyltransferase|nr:sugar phosphate nucleotidyltransferase [Gemmatimonadales bacterium]